MTSTKKPKSNKKNSIDKNKTSSYITLDSKQPTGQYFSLDIEGEEYYYLSFYVGFLRDLGISVINNDNIELLLLALEKANAIYDSIEIGDPNGY